jgi:hypothetical protein
MGIERGAVRKPVAGLAITYRYPGLIPYSFINSNFTTSLCGESDTEMSGLYNPGPGIWIDTISHIK